MLLLRFALVLLLYLFLGGLVVAVWKGMQRPGAAETKVEKRSSAPRARLVVVEPGGTTLPQGHSFVLPEECSIGRGPDNDIVLADSFVSTAHAAINYGDGSWWIEDLGSRNGSLVNGQRVETKTRLKPGDQIAIGQVRLRLSA